ncbi:hypothetical protein MRX96_058609 [Rhipicephalus microplus]
MRTSSTTRSAQGGARVVIKGKSCARHVHSQRSAASMATTRRRKAAQAGRAQTLTNNWPFPFLKLAFRNALMEAAVVFLQHCHYTPKVKPVPNDGTSSAASINDNCDALDLVLSQAANGEK